VKGQGHEVITALGMYVSRIAYILQLTFVLPVLIFSDQQQMCAQYWL